MEPALRRFWENAAAMLSLVGRPLLHSEANVFYKT